MTNRRQVIGIGAGLAAFAATGVAAEAGDKFVRQWDLGEAATDVTLVSGDKMIPVKWRLGQEGSDDHGLLGAYKATLDALVDAELAGIHIDCINVSREMYRALRHGNELGMVYGLDGLVVTARAFLGHHVRVPGTALA